MKTSSLVVCLCAFAVGLPLAGQSVAPAYRFKVLAKTGDTIGGKTLTNVGQPALNRWGDVAFIGFAPGIVGVFTPDRLVRQTGDAIGGAMVTGIAGPPAISDWGFVLFNGATNRGSGIYSPFGAVAETGDRIGGQTLTGLGPVRSSDWGVVAFLGEYSGGRGIFNRSGVIAQEGSVVGGKTLTQVGFAPAVNDRGAVAVLGFFDGGSGIFTSPSAFRVKSGDVVDGKTLTSVTFASLNNDGDLAYVAYFAGGSGVFRRSRLVAQGGGTVLGKKVGGFGGVAMNNRDVVAFTSTPDFSSADCRLCNGVFTASSVVAYSGDVIGGKTVSSVAHDIAINDAGEIVFAAAFTDGSTAIVLAQPRETVFWTWLTR